MNNVKQVIDSALEGIEIPFDTSKMGIFERAAINKLMGGKQPIEFLRAMIASLPDEFIPHIVEVAKAIARASE